MIVTLEKNGIQYDVEAPDGMPDDEIIGNFNNAYKARQTASLNALAAGQPEREYTPQEEAVRSRQRKSSRYTPGRGLPKHLVPFKEWIKDAAPPALDINPKDFDPEGSAPAKQRAILSTLYDSDTKHAYLVDIYGEENVKVANVSGNDEFFIRPKKVDKGKVGIGWGATGPTLIRKGDKEAGPGQWKMVDPGGALEFSDITADAAGAALPVIAGATTAVASIASGSGIPYTAFLSNVAEATVGTTQDAYMRSKLGLPLKLGEIGKRRGFDATVGFVAEMALMGAGKLIPNLFIRKGAEAGAEAVEFLAGKSGKKMPTQMFLGTKTLEGIREVARSKPTSPIARLYKDLREFIGRSVDDEVGVASVSAAQSDKIIQETLEKVANDQSNQINHLKKVAGGLQEEGESVKFFNEKLKKTTQETSKDIASEVFNDERKRRARDLVASNEIPTLPAGETLQNDVLRQFLAKNQEKNALYDKAYEIIGDASVKGSVIADAYSEIVSLGVDELDENLVKVLGSVAAKNGLRSADELGKLGDIDVPFSVVNELIQLANKKAKPGVVGSGPEAARFKKLSAELQQVRNNILSQNPDGEVAFNAAQDFYKDEYLRLTDGIAKPTLKLRAGQNLNEAKKAFVDDPTNIPVPRFALDGVGVVKAALSSPGAARELIDISSDPIKTRETLQQLWTQRNGLMSDGGLEKRLFDLNDDSKEMVRMLWPQTDAAGKNTKLETFKEVHKFLSDEKAFTDGVTRETYQRLMGTNTIDAERQLINLAKEEIATKEKIDEISVSAIRKLLKKGALDGSAKDNIRILMDSMDTLSFREVQEVRNLLIKQDPLNLDLLKNSALEHLLKRAGRGSSTNEAQLGKYGYELWNTKTLANIIKKDEAKLSVMLGSEKLNLLKKWNAALQVVEVPRTEKQLSDLRLGVNTGGNGANTYLSGITGWAQKHWLNAMLNVSMKAPTRRIVQDARAFDEMMNRLMVLSASTAPGLSALGQTTLSDPQARDMLLNTFKGLTDDLAQFNPPETNEGQGGALAPAE